MYRNNTNFAVLISIVASLSIFDLAHAGGLQSEVAWSVPTVGQTPVGMKPAIGPDGTVYTVNSGQLVAVSLQGETLWSVDAIDGQVSVGQDGTVYAASGPAVRAFNPDGSDKWSYDAEILIIAGPAVGPDGNIYAVDEHESFGGIGMFSLDPDGNFRWSNTGSPVLSSDETIPHELVFGDAHVYVAFRPDGQTGAPALWAFDFAGDQAFVLLGSCQGTPAINPLSGNLVTSNPQCQHVETYDAQNGSLIWSEAPPSPSPCSGLADVAVGPDGAVYTAFCYRAFWSLDAAGDDRWFDDDADLYYRMERLGVSPDNSVVVELGVDFSQPAGRFRTYSTEDGSLLSEMLLPDDGAIAITPPVFDVARNRVYFNARNVAANMSFLYAFDLFLTTPGDIDGDGVVGISDLLQLLAAWGPCDGAPCPADLDGNNIVNVADLLVLLAHWA